jgi:hypothetical protein
MIQTNSMVPTGDEFVPTLIRTVTWEAWTWEGLGQEIRKRSRGELLQAITEGDSDNIRILLNLNMAYRDAIDDVLADLNGSSGPVAIRDPRRQYVILALLEYLDREDRC